MQYNQKAVDVAAEVSKAVFGKPQTIRTIWMAMLAGGHVLIEDIPGVGKTTLALAGMARAAAYLAGRDFVAPQDVTAVFADVARHRLVLADQAKAGGETVDVVIDDLLRTVPRPRPEKADRHGR